MDADVGFVKQKNAARSFGAVLISRVGCHRHAHLIPSHYNQWVVIASIWPQKLLHTKHCVPCRGGEPPLRPAEIEKFLQQVPDWEFVTENEVPRLRRSFKFRDFAHALTFTQKVGEVAEEEEHHPVIVTEWGMVTVSWWTHKIKGLHQNDFIMAAKTDALYANLG